MAPILADSPGVVLVAADVASIAVVAAVVAVFVAIVAVVVLLHGRQSTLPERTDCIGKKANIYIQ